LDESDRAPRADGCDHLAANSIVSSTTRRWAKQSSAPVATDGYYWAIAEAGFAVIASTGGCGST
jgi:hypothetical protein